MAFWKVTQLALPIAGSEYYANSVRMADNAGL